MRHIERLRKFPILPAITAVFVLMIATATLSLAQETSVAKDWAQKLAPYKADTTQGSKGYYGIPTTDVKQILGCKPAYDEAKRVYDEFKSTGIDPEDDWELKSAEWDIRVAIQNYEKSIGNVVADAETELANAEEFLNRDAKNAQLFSKANRQTVKDKVADVEALLPSEDPRRVAVKERFSKIEAKLAEGDKSRVASIRMKPDVYKGKDSQKLKAKAKAIVLSKNPGAKILRITITKKTWQRESVIEATDTTNTALQHRMTDAIYANVAAKEGNDCALYTVYLHKDKIGGSVNALQGHIMFKDPILEANVGK